MRGLLWTETERMYLGDGEDGDWIVFRKYITAADREYVFSRSASVERDVGEGVPDNAKMKINPLRFNLATVERMIEEWSFVFPSEHPKGGMPVPTTEQYIGMLDSETLGEIVDSINKHNPQRSDEETSDMEEQVFLGAGLGPRLAEGTS
jgi:hypothetical protein